MRTLETAVERWPIAGSFTISRGSRTEAVVVVAKISEGAVTGQGECVPYARYGESIDSVVAQIVGVTDAIAGGASRLDLLRLLPAGAAGGQSHVVLPVAMRRKVNGVGGHEDFQPRRAIPGQPVAPPLRVEDLALWWMPAQESTDPARCFSAVQPIGFTSLATQERGRQMR